MNVDSIVIKWQNSVEHLDINLDDLNSLDKIDFSLEYYVEEEEWVQYNIKSRIKGFPNGEIQLILDYHKNANTHLDPNSVCWGTSTVILKKGATKGVATWSDCDNVENNGGVSWTRVERKLINKMRRQNVTRLQRDQAKLRNHLLMLERCCVLTGEATGEALNAAHIIPCKEGGADILQNSFILRSDIHSLYDAGKFSIDPLSGCVVEINGVSSTYQDLLTKAKLPLETFKRTQQALQFQWKNSGKM